MSSGVGMREAVILNPSNRVWMPCLGYGVDLIDKGQKDAGINGLRSRHVGATLPRTTATRQRSGQAPCNLDLV